MAEIFYNDKYLGSCKDGMAFIKDFKERRREGKIDDVCNIHYNKELDYVYVDSTPGRVRRPLIIVEDGEPRLTDEIINKLKSQEWSFKDLITNGIIEYLDTYEEENSLVANYPKDLTIDHTHLEISPSLIIGICSGMTPYSDYDDAARLLRAQKSTKQAIGLYALNFLKKVETDKNILVNPQRPLTETFNYELFDLNKHPAGQNLVVAVMSYEGYNMEDGIILNKGSVERGLLRTFYFKKYSSSEIKYPGGLQDRIAIPTKDVKGYSSEEDYRYLEEDGIIYVGQYVTNGDVLIGKISPPRFIEEIEGFGQMINLNVDSSLALKEEESGVVSSVHIIENSDGDKQINILLRTQRPPIVGDKLASRHGQKGVIGAIMPQEDMPFSENGIIPDMIFSPHSIPSRKTVSHVMEILAGKVAALRGKNVDATPFDSENIDTLREELESYGFSKHGTEAMYHPKTGKKINAEIYIGSIYYLRLKHQVANKIQARGTGPVQLLTRQPAEGRARGGGLKLGEMEKDTLISHGVSLLLKERFSSDQTRALICQSCGYLADPYLFNYRSKCPICGSSKFDEVELAYAFKLFINELKSMGLNPAFGTKDKFFEK